MISGSRTFGIPDFRDKHYEKFRVDIDDDGHQTEISSADLYSTKRYAHHRSPSEEGQKAWDQFALFLKSLPGLKDLTWESPRQVPTSVLSALHGRGVRLHIYVFSLSSALQPKGEIHGLDEDDIALAMSPNIYSITLPLELTASRGVVDHNEEVLHDMVAGLAPGLRIVRTVGMRFDIAGHVDQSAERLQPPWKDDLPKTVPFGQLTKLALLGDARPDRIPSWSRVTQFSKLQDLEIYCVTTPDMDELIKMAVDGEFRNLRHLSLHWYFEKGTDELLRALPPLESLRLGGDPSPSAYTAILHLHGSALHTLKYEPRYATNYDLNDLPRHCPNLREAQLAMCRSRGDSREVRTYRSLNSLRKLETLGLSLSTPEIDDGGLFGVRWLQEHLANGAMDSKLAGSISQILFKGHSRLKKVTLSISNSGFYGWSPQINLEFEYVFRLVAREWVCSRDVGNTDEISLEKINPHGNYLEDPDPKLDLSCNIDSWVEDNAAAWRGLWPLRGDDWWKNWESLPLADVEE